MGSCVNGVSGVSDGEIDSRAADVWLKSRGIISKALMEIAESNKNLLFLSHTREAMADVCQHNAAAIIARLAQKDLLIVKASELDEDDRRKGSSATSATAAGDYPDHTGLYTLGVLMLGMAVIFGTSWFLFNAMQWVAGWFFMPMAFILTVLSCAMVFWMVFVVVSFVETHGK